MAGGGSEPRGVGGDMLWINVCLWQEHLGRWGCPPGVRMARGDTVLGEDQVQLRLAESEQPMRQPEECVSEAAGSQAWGSRERPWLQTNLEVGWYLKS